MNALERQKMSNGMSQDDTWDELIGPHSFLQSDYGLISMESNMHTSRASANQVSLLQQKNNFLIYYTSTAVPGDDSKTRVFLYTQPRAKSIFTDGLRVPAGYTESVLLTFPPYKTACVSARLGSEHFL